MQQLTMVSKTTDSDGHVMLTFDDGTGMWFETESDFNSYAQEIFDAEFIAQLLRQCAVRCVADNPSHTSCVATWNDADPSGNYVNVVDAI